MGLINKLTKILAPIALATALLTGVFGRKGETGYTTREIELDQVFQNRYGITLVYTDENRVVQNQRVLPNFADNCNHAWKGFCRYPNMDIEGFETFNSRVKSGYKIIRDDSRAEGIIARVLEFEDGHNFYEIRLPTRDKLTPGFEGLGRAQGKIYENLNELE